MAIVEIHITLKPALFDAQGATVLKALHQLGHTQVRAARIGKYITLEVDDATVGPGLQQQLDLMCQRLLANPVIENYEITLSAPTSRREGGASVTELPVTPAPINVSPTLGAASAQAATPPAGATFPLASAISSAPAASTMSPPSTTIPPATTPSLPTPPLPAPPPATPSMATPAATMPEAATSVVANPTIAGTPTSVTPGASAIIVPATSSAAVDELATPGGLPLPDPFALDYRTYQAMSPDAQLAIQERAWQQHGTWIAQQLNSGRAAWILCVGGQVVESGPTLDTYPDAARLAQLGAANDLVPWIFTRPPQ